MVNFFFIMEQYFILYEWLNGYEYTIKSPQKTYINQKRRDAYI